MSTTLLSSRLLSLFKNGQWKEEDVVKLFTALVKEFNDTNEDFYTWMKKILYKVEIHKIRASELTLPNNDQFVDCVAVRINDIIKNNGEKTLDEIMKEISEQKVIDERVMAEVKDIVLSVSECLSSSTTPHLQGINQILFKLCKAVEKTMKIKPRLTQMVSWCLLVLSESSQLVQVGTGEGKSCIVAMFAAYQAIIGKTPDIISSSPVLAERDANEWSSFYKELGITVCVNTNKTKDSDLKKCYECQVVYGTTESFAGDYLRQRFHRQDVRPKREFQCVIVDEVDSLMLDKGLEVVYLSTDVPLMESLNEILAEIWYIVNQLKHLDTGEILGPIQQLSQILSENILENDNIDQLKVVQAAVNAGILPTTSFIQKQDVKNVLKQLDNASVTQMVAFLTMFVRNFPEYDFKLYLQEPDEKIRKLNEICTSSVNRRQEIPLVLLGCGQCRLVYFKEEVIVKSLVERFKKVKPTLIKKQNVSCVPGLRDLIDGKMQTWIENALEAKKMTFGHEYILHKDGVVPVDYSCTAVVQNNMTWGEGLQQFLEMKNQTKLSNTTLITNFMSNVGLFKKYSNIYGITGTLGDQTELDMLKELYDGIKACKIPSFRCRKLYEMEGLVIPEEKDWIRNICNVVKEQVSSTDYRGPRAALVICETINRAEMLYEDLDSTILKGKLKLYINNNMNNSPIVDETVQAGDVIIATNLAGRGTDLKVCDSVKEAGGLFVLQTFLPLNVRVEQQAFGRTACQGSPGSAQLIVCCNHFSDSVKLTMVSNTSQSSKSLDCLINFTCAVTESIFESGVNLFKENPSSQNHKIMVSALTDLLTLESFPFGNLDEAKDARNIVVKIRLSRLLNKDIPQITKKEELFSVYLEILDNIYKNDCFSEERDVIVSSFHECWGHWLLMNFSKEKSIDILKQQLKVDLLSAIGKLLCKESPSSMVYYYMRSGNKLRQNGCIAESIEMYTKAVEDGDYGEIIAQYNRALAIITKKDPGYIARALTDLENADKGIDLYKLHMRHILTLVKLSTQEPKTEVDNLLTKQFQVKAVVLNLLKINIQDAVMKLKRAERSGREVKLTTKHAVFLIEHMLDCSATLLTQLSMELHHIISLGLETVFSLDTLFSFSGFLSRVLK